MNKEDVVKILSNLSYRPGWTFDARETYDYEWWLAPTDDVILKMTCATVNTDRDMARQGYPDKRDLDWEVPVTSAMYADDGQLLRAVFDLIMQIELHESREFFRVKSEDYAAPFHPHRADGEALWAETEG